MSHVNTFDEVVAPLDKLHRDDILNPEHSSYYFKTQEYDLFILRFLKLDDDDGLKGISTPYIIHNYLIYRYDRELNNFIHFKNHNQLLDSIEEDLRHSEWIVRRYIEEIDKLEDGLYTRKIPSIFLDVWFDLKKDLTRVDRILDRVDEVLQEYALYYQKNEDFPSDTLTNILEHTQKSQRLANLHSLKLDTLYNYYNSLKNDKINNNIYFLTVLSGVFLPLNLVVGFFGINTENLFFSGNPEGTINVMKILIGMFISLLLLFPLIKIVERLILQRVLGKFSLYNTLVKKIKKTLSNE